MALAAIALHVVLAWLGHVPAPRTLMGDELVYWPAAQQLAAGAPVDYSPLWPQGYLWFLAAVVATFGAHSLAVEVVQTLLLLAAAWMIRDLGRSWTGSARVGDVAGGFAALYPPLAAYAHYFWPEVLHLFFLVAALWLVSSDSRSGTGRNLVAGGALLGLAVTTKHLLVPFLPVVLLAAARTRRKTSDEAAWAWRRAAWILVGLGLVVIPIRAVAPSGEGSAAVFNLWLGWNDAERGADEGYRDYLERGPTTEARDAALREELSDQLMDHLRSGGWLSGTARQARKQALRFFDSETYLDQMLHGKSVHAEAAGYRDPPAWLVTGISGASHWLYGGLLVGGLWGVVVTFSGRRRNPWLWVAAAFLAYNLVLFFFLHVKTRYRIQCLPFLFIFCGQAAVWLWARFGRFSRFQSPPARALSRVRAGLAALGSALLLYLAFGDAAPVDPGSIGAKTAPLVEADPAGVLWAEPGSIAVCSPSTLGLTTIHWQAEASEKLFEVRVESPDGPLFARGTHSGSAETGEWVRNGMQFFLLEVTDAGSQEISVIRVGVVQRDCKESLGSE